MKKYLWVITVLIFVWVTTSYSLYTQRQIANQSSDAITFSEDKIATTTVTSVVEIATTTSGAVKMSADVVVVPQYKRPAGIYYNDTVKHFSLTIPAGWSSKVQTDTASSTYAVSFAPSLEIDKDDPEPILVIKYVDLNASTSLDFEGNQEASKLIVELGNDGFINWMIDNVFKKEFNDFKIQSLAKKNISGTAFYIVDSTYTSEQTFKDVRFLSYIHLNKDRIITVSSYVFVENQSQFKNDLMSAINTISL